MEKKFLNFFRIPSVLTKGQESKLKVLVERNNYYDRHPYIRRSRYTEKDEDEIEHLLEMTRWKKYF